MQITKLRLLGFKSFVEPTELIIGNGLTGVVGPNGCGKSNLLEALRWVMGETSYKTMRASAMDDVIFSGTQNRPSRNSAEVSLFLDNSERTAPAEFNDTDSLEITRRIEREVGSAYHINGRDTRARDIKLLFEDAATGARSNAIVQQGQIGQIISAKPQARRRLLEDAAGIAGLHSRRHEAELRLKAAETNLLRVADTLGQLASQMNSLKRQARQARRYKELSVAIRQAEALFFHLNWQQICSEVDDEEARLREGLIEIATATKEQTKASTSHLKMSETLAPLRDEEAACAAIYQRLMMEQDALEKEAERLRERQRQLASLQTQTEQDREREEQRQIEAETSLAKLTEEKNALQKQGASVKDHREALEAEHETLSSKLYKTETKLAELLSNIAEHRAGKSQIETSIRQQAESRDRAIKSHEHITSERAELDTSTATNATTTKDTLKETLAGLIEQVASIEGETNTAEQRLVEHQDRERAMRDGAEKARAKANHLIAEITTLDKLVSPESDGVSQPLIDSIKVDDGFETAFATAFGEDLNAPADKAAPVHWTLTESHDDPHLPKGTTPLGDVVDAPNLLERRLAQIGLVDGDKGAELQFKLSPGQCLVSKEGDMWRWDGYVSKAGAQTPAAQRLAERNRLDALKQEQPTVLAAAERAEKALADAREQLQATQETERKLRNDWRELQHTIGQTRNQISTHEQELNKSQAQRIELDAAIQNAEENRQSADRTIAELRTQLKSLGDTAALEQQFETVQADVVTQRAGVAECAGKRAGLDREAQLRADRLKAIVHETEQWTHRNAQSKNQAASLKQRMAEFATELATLSDIPAQIETRRGTLLNKLGTAETNRKEAADKLAKADTSVLDASKQLKHAETILATLREDKARTETRLENAREKRSALTVQINDALACNPDECLTKAELEDTDAPLPSFSEIDRKLAGLRNDRERVGGVNLSADEELTAISTRHSELDRERQDLDAAIAELRAGINKLNREGRKRLLEAFDEVNKHFQTLFTSLFGGGKAELQLVDADDPLDAGLEIMARPPGKKPNTMSLLSGGEQALTALSLIFAVFLTNPSPICVLDEVDAPLDDANVDRFCNLLDEMSKQTDTRFLVITHHPMTMSRMNRLFGVTMAERGVSQLVSVDLETAETYREAS